MIVYRLEIIGYDEIKNAKEIGEGIRDGKKYGNLIKLR